MSTITIQTATQKDIPLIKKLAHRIWWAHYPSVISEAQIEFMLDMNYTEAALEKQMEHGAVFHVVYQANTAIGYVAIAAGKSENSYFIHKFYLDTAKHSKGLGSSVFAQIVVAYPDAKTIRLAVNRQNFKSINFYFKNGFKIEKCLDTPIGNGYVMDDFVMLWRRNVRTIE